MISLWKTNKIEFKLWLIGSSVIRPLLPHCHHLSHSSCGVSTYCTEPCSLLSVLFDHTKPVLTDLCICGALCQKYTFFIHPVCHCWVPTMTGQTFSRDWRYSGEEEEQKFLPSLSFHSSSFPGPFSCPAPFCSPELRLCHLREHSLSIPPLEWDLSFFPPQ